MPDQAAVTRAIAAAKANGQTVELDLFPLHSQIFTGASKCAPSTDPQACGNTAQIQAFAAWTGQVAAAFPTVHQFVVMNECNQPLFVNPQWDSSGQNQSAEICGRALAASYDVLKRASRAELRLGSRPLAARQRQPERGEQLVHDPGHVPRRRSAPGSRRSRRRPAAPGR